MKKLALFILLQVILIALLVGTLNVYNKNITSRNNRPTIIKIVGVDPKTDQLILQPDADSTVLVCKGRKVTWINEPSSNIKEFRLEMKDESSQIFFPILRPRGKHKKEAWGTVNRWIADKKVYSYNIFWTMNDNPANKPERKLDPKLAINPNFHLAPLEKLIYTGYIILTLLTFSVFFINKKELVR